jgi:hypothetical protein
VRHDLPRLAAELGHQGPLRRLPFLGSWTVWQRALAIELQALAAAAEPGQGPPLLLHHPLQGPLAARYLAVLTRRCGVSCRPASFDASDPQAADRDAAALRAAASHAAEPQATAAALGATAISPDAVMLPLALAANRLTDRLAASAPCLDSRPLLQRPRLRQVLLAALEALA